MAKNIEKMTVVELRAAAKQYPDIKNTHSMTKADLIAALKNATKPQAPRRIIRRRGLGIGI